MRRSGNNETFRWQTSIQSMKMLSIKSMKSKLSFSVGESVIIHTRHIRGCTNFYIGMPFLFKWTLYIVGLTPVPWSAVSWRRHRTTVINYLKMCLYVSLSTQSSQVGSCSSSISLLRGEGAPLCVFQLNCSYRVSPP